MERRFAQNLNDPIQNHSDTSTCLHKILVIKTIFQVMFTHIVTVDEFEYNPTRKFETETNKISRWNRLASLIMKFLVWETVDVDHKVFSMRKY